MIISTYLVYAGFVFICLGMEKHYKSIFKNDFSKNFQRIVFFIGYSLLGISLVMYIDLVGLSLGITFWISIMAPLVIIIALILTYNPKLLISVSFFLLLVSILFSFIY